MTVAEDIHSFSYSAPEAEVVVDNAPQAPVFFDELPVFFRGRDGSIQEAKEEKEEKQLPPLPPQTPPPRIIPVVTTPNAPRRAPAAVGLPPRMDNMLLPSHIQQRSLVQLAMALAFATTATATTVLPNHNPLLLRENASINPFGPPFTMDAPTTHAPPRPVRRSLMQELDEEWRMSEH